MFIFILSCNSVHGVFIAAILSHCLGRPGLFDFMGEKPTRSFSVRSGSVVNSQGGVREVMQAVQGGRTTSCRLRPPLCLFYPLSPFQSLIPPCRMNSFPFLPLAWLTMLLSGMPSLARLFAALPQSRWPSDHPVPTGKTPEEVLKKYLQKVRHPPDEVSAGTRGRAHLLHQPPAFLLPMRQELQSPDRYRAGLKGHFTWAPRLVVTRGGLNSLTSPYSKELIDSKLP